MSSLAAARADNFYIPNNFDPNRPSRAPRPDNMKKDYSLIRLNFYQDMRSCFTLDVFNVRK
jgi:hypothetical protein